MFILVFESNIYDATSSLPITKPIHLFNVIFAVCYLYLRVGVYSHQDSIEPEIEEVEILDTSVSLRL